MTRSSAQIYGLCVLCLFLGSIQVATAVKCLVCPENKLENCAPTDDLSKKVKFVEFNCTAGCGKLISWNPKQPTQNNYVGLRKTVRTLEYKYCLEKVTWTGCYKSESAVTTSIECVCSDKDGCNQAGRQSAGPWALTVPLMMMAWAMAA